MISIKSLYKKLQEKYDKKTIILGTAVVVLILIFGFRLLQISYIVWQRTSGGTPPVTVSATPVKVIDTQPFITSIVTLQAINGVNLAAQVPGVINKIFFESGQMVEKGQPIIAMDTSVLEAQLQNAEAVMNYKQVTFQRYDSLYKKGVVSHDQYDSARSDLNQAMATINQLKALIDQMSIEAPFAGKLGLRQVNLGQYLTPGTTITTLEQLDPIYANFNIPSKNISQVKPGQEIQVTVDSYPGEIYTGKVTAVDAIIDQDTRGINIQGTVANPQKELTPGMYGEVKILLPVEKNALVVPQTAVTYTLYGNSIFVVNESKDKSVKKILTISQRYVTLGERQGTTIIVTEGLKPGDKVVTSGQLKLQDGVNVVIDNSAGL